MATVEELLARECTPRDVAAAEAAGWAAKLWGRLDEVGLTLISVPEQAGGPGGALDDAWAVLEQAGRYSVPLPLAESALLAGWLLARAGLPLRTGPMTVAPPQSPTPRAEPLARGGGWRLSGQAGGVPWGAHATTLVLLVAAPDGDAVASVPVSECRTCSWSNIAGEPRTDVDLDGVVIASDALGHPSNGLDVGTLERRGALVRSVQIVGALTRALALSVEHIASRTQFGRPLARFQAVQHHVAVMVRETTLARAAVAAATADTDDLDVPLAAVAIAKVRACIAARTVATLAHQVHGAMGITSEYELQLVTRRLMAWGDEFGDELHWAGVLGELACGSGDALWQTVTASVPPRAGGGS